MARNWKDVKGEALASGKLNPARIAAHCNRLRARVRAHRLAEIREDYGLDQETVASRLGVSQARVSNIERGDVDHTEVSTIRSYVAALGGDVEVSARFGDESFIIA